MASACLYRHFDKDGRLLYVGVSLSAFRRLEQHREDKAAWVHKTARMDIQRFRSRSAALKAEARAICTENPVHNIQRPKLEPRRERRERFPHDHPTMYEYHIGRAHEAAAKWAREGFPGANLRDTPLDETEVE